MSSYPNVLVQLLLGEGGAGLRGERAEVQRRVQRGEERHVRTRSHPSLSHPEVHRKWGRARHRHRHRAIWERKESWVTTFIPTKKKNTFTYTKHRRKQYLKGGQCKQTQVNHCLEKGWLIYTAITHTRSTTNPSAKIEPLSQAVGKVTIYMYIQSTSRVGKRAKNKNTVAGYSFQDNIRDALCSSLKGKRNWTLVFSI